MEFEQIAEMFDTDGAFRFARWARSMAPVVFGIEGDSMQVMHAAFQTVAGMTRMGVAEIDPELGSNVMMFFCRDWDELLSVPDLDKMVPDIAQLVPKLIAQNANSYRTFRFEDGGAIKAAFVFVNMSGAMGEMSAQELALSQVVQITLTWGAGFAKTSPLAVLPDGRAVIRPEIVDVIRAAYASNIPANSDDASLALRIAARIGSTP